MVPRLTQMKVNLARAALLNPENLFRLQILASSVGDPDPQDPHVLGTPGSGSTSQRYRYGSGSFPFSEIMLAK